ncbi:IS200/IS605 family transposase [Dyadobacter diqingensis]|uniref:IS200/IS605 family transposase n=1 Tax=Dyadobacter diqingensis TaxID=2938121 RepID=UPI0020C3DE6B|nr:IS200/IS605 family transposase [Dyadobacter diqingensis]
MANTYHQMYIQTVFAVNYREAIIQSVWKKDLFSVIGNLINETGCKTLIVNGVEDHVHCFFGLKPSVSISDVMKNAKAKSSKWVNESSLLPHRFEWQEGYSAFSYSRSHIDAVHKYIQNQEKHHSNRTFKEEYVDMLAKFEVTFDEKYIFTDLI